MAMGVEKERKVTEEEYRQEVRGIKNKRKEEGENSRWFIYESELLRAHTESNLDLKPYTS